MPMKSPPHPGRSVRENCVNPLGLSVTEAVGGSGSCPPHPFTGIERSLGYLARNGNPPGEGRMVQRRLLAEPSDFIRPGPGAQGGRRNTSRAVPVPAHSVG